MVRRSKRVVSPRGTIRAQGRPTSDEAAELTAGQLMSLVATAFAENEDIAVDNIARMAAPPKGGDSDPTRETILSYIKPPRRPSLRGKGSTRRNRDTPVHYKLAHLVLNYLDGRRADGQHVTVPASISDATPWRTARRVCKKVLRSEREKRFERPLGNDPGMRTSVSLIAGVYALCRRESSDQRYHQELLILRNSGSRKNPRCHCTLITDSVVTRGEWMLMGNLVYCSMSGLRDDNTHEVGGLYLAHVAGHDLLSGFLAGASTEMRYPVAMPIVAIKIPDASESILELGDFGDETILKSFRPVQGDLEAISETLHAILKVQMEPVLFDASECNPELRRAFDGGRRLISSRLREFCKSVIQ